MRWWQSSDTAMAVKNSNNREVLCVVGLIRYRVDSSDVAHVQDAR